MKRILTTLAVTISPTRAVAGDFIEISVGNLYLLGLILSLPGIIASVPMVWASIKSNRFWSFSLLLSWFLILPWLILATVGVLVPDVFGHIYRFGSWQNLALIWIPGIIGIPLVSALVMLIVNLGRKSNNRRQSSSHDFER